MLNIQSDNPNDLAAEVQKLKALISKHGVTVVFEQAGATLPGVLRGHEHFGFKDCVSQPGVAGFDLATPIDLDPDPSAKPLGHVLGHLGTEIIQAGEFILGEPVETDSPSSGQKFSPPPSLTWMVNGSFQILRRLRQDVPGFIAQQERDLGPLPKDNPLHETLGAKLVGRWKSGTPIDLSPDKDNNLTDKLHDNNFNFTTTDASGLNRDDDGFRCPRFAHIRKVYPRERDFATNRSRRIIRRGSPFGLPFDPNGGSGHDANSERGLLFVAYMSSIENKFEFLMHFWVNNPNFPVSGAGPDPIIGENPQGTPNPKFIPIDLKQQGKSNFKPVFPRFVHTTGTLYAFVPSITALNEMANGKI